MAKDMTKEPTTSQEFAIDTTVDALLGKLMSGNITAAEQSQYQQLLIQRSRLMRPSMMARMRRRAAA